MVMTAEVLRDSVLPILSTEKYLIILCITAQLTHGTTILVPRVVGVHVDHESVIQYRVLPTQAPLSVAVKVIV
jgi:hypothetical protein